MEPDETTPVNVNFDYRDDSNGKDPDSASPSLRAAHRALWNKELPNGAHLTLNDSGPDYLHARVNELEFALGSDTIATSHPGSRAADVRAAIGEETIEQFRRDAGKLGGRMVWPVRRIHQPTINQARGTRAKISDRIDLTLDSLRLWYHDSTTDTPLTDVFENYADWFGQFGSGAAGWQGFIDFFLLEDILDEEGKVKFFASNTPTAIPKDAGDFKRYLDAQLEFVNARNQRIVQWCRDNRVPLAE